MTHLLIYHVIALIRFCWWRECPEPCKVSERKVKPEDQWQRKEGCWLESITKFMGGGDTEIRKEMKHFLLPKLFVHNFIRNWLVVGVIFGKAVLSWETSEPHSPRDTYCRILDLESVARPGVRSLAPRLANGPWTSQERTGWWYL